VTVTDFVPVSPEASIIGISKVILSPASRSARATSWSTANQSYYIKLYCEPIFNSIKAKANQILMIENIKVKTEEM
jgi:hypothetical protein